VTTGQRGGKRSGSGQPSPWGEGETKLVRVPARFANRETLQRYLLDVPEAIDRILEQLEPRKELVRAKEAYEQLTYLKSLIS
jgi:hypothetical protein